MTIGTNPLNPIALTQQYIYTKVILLIFSKQKGQLFGGRFPFKIPRRCCVVSRLHLSGRPGLYELTS